MEKFVAFVLKQSLLFNLLTVVGVIVGIMQVSRMKREAFPSVDLDMVIIRTYYPGASPREIETYVTMPIEREIRSIQGIKEQQSSSSDSISRIQLLLQPDLSDKEKTNLLMDLQKALDRIVDLPNDLPARPFLSEIQSGMMPVIEVSLSGDVPYQELHKAAEDLADILSTLPDVADVVKSGFQEREFIVEVDPQKLRQFNLTTQAVISSIQSQNINLPGGKIESDQGSFILRTLGEVKNKAEIGAITIRSNDLGQQIKVSDVAEVTEGFEDSLYIYRTDGSPSINLNIRKVNQGDIITVVDAVRKRTEQFTKTYENQNIEVAFINDMSVYVRNRLNVLTSNGVLGTILVLITLVLFLSRGIAIVTALGMPIAFLGALILMSLFNISINLITMFGLIIVLGMLVDDAIIVAENIWHYYERGDSIWDAAVKGTAEVFWPVTATILTSIAAFSPMLFIEGTFGKFIWFLPMVVIFSLSMSLIEAMFVLPSHAADIMHLEEKYTWLRSRKKIFASEDHFPKIVDQYGLLLVKLLHRRYLICVGFLFIFIATLLFSIKFMPFMMYPPQGIESFFIRGELPLTYNLEQSQEVFAKIEAAIKEELKSDELENMTTWIGSQTSGANDPFPTIGSHLGQIRVFLTPENSRDRDADAMIQALKDKIEPKTQDWNLVNLSFPRIKTGPSAGEAISVSISANEFNRMEDIAKKYVEKLKSTPHVHDIRSQVETGKEEVIIDVDPSLASQSLLTTQSIARHIQTAFSGSIASYVRQEDQRVPIRVRYPKKDRQNISAIEDLTVVNERGNIIDLRNIVDIKKAAGIQSIYHKDFERNVSITASVDEQKTTSTAANVDLLTFTKLMQQENPDVLISQGGEFEDTQESKAGLIRAFAVGLMLIFVILATQFNSLIQPIVVMTAIPLGLVGVIWALYFHQQALSFIAVIGAIGLSGVIVNDSIVLVSFINQSIARGLSAWDACIYAGKRRFRAVCLTTITTVVGILPLAYGIGGEDKFLKPAALALGYGLLFGTILILFFIPASYLILDDIKSSKFFKKRES